MMIRDSGSLFGPPCTSKVSATCSTINRNRQMRSVL